MLTFRFSGTCGVMTEPEVLTSGMVGKELMLEFSPEWEGLTKTVVFSNGSISADVVYTGGPITIPARVLEKPLRTLSVGVYGVSSDGKLVIPTIRAKGPGILPGVEPAGVREEEPELPIWAQLQGLMGPLEDLETENRENLVAAINEAAKTGGIGTGGGAGVTFTPAVSEDGILSWTNNGGLKNPEPVNLTGPSGADGRDGQNGQDGQDGVDGQDGKSAYTYAREGGYVGTEAEFAEKLAREIPETMSNPYALTFTGSVQAVYDGSKPVSVAIPDSSGGSSGDTEWKKLTETTIAEEGVMDLVFTQTEDGNTLIVNEFILFAKTMPRETVNSFRVYCSTNGSVLIQTNNFGNNTAVKYYAMSYLKIGNRIKAEMIEGNADLFKENSVYPLASNIYSDGVQYYKQTTFTPTSYLKVAANAGFVVGDIVEIWYR